VVGTDEKKHLVSRPKKSGDERSAGGRGCEKRLGSGSPHETGSSTLNMLEFGAERKQRVSRGRGRWKHPHRSKPALTRATPL